MGGRRFLVVVFLVAVLSSVEVAAASARTRASTEAEDNLPPIELLVVASPDPFSPNGDGRSDETVIVVTSSAAGSITVSIVDAGGEAWRTWPDLPLLEPGSMEITWEGRAGSVRVPDGRYDVVALLSAGDGASATAAAPLTIDRQAPTLRRLRVRTDPLTTHRFLKVRFAGWDRAPILRTELRIEDAIGAIGKQATEAPRGPTRVRWRTRYRSGQRLYPGNYRLGIRLSDDAGNASGRRWIPWRVHRNVGGHVYRRLEGTGRRVALTFDDCGNGAAWASILRTLHAKNVEAAFFCGGGAVRGNPRLARRTVRDGHTPGSHALDHAILTGHDPSFTTSRVRADRRAWWQVARRTSAPYLRPPYGAYNAAVVEGAAAARPLASSCGTSIPRTGGTPTRRRSCVGCCRRHGRAASSFCTREIRRPPRSGRSWTACERGTSSRWASRRSSGPQGCAEAYGQARMPHSSHIVARCQRSPTISDVGGKSCPGMGYDSQAAA